MNLFQNLKINFLNTSSVIANCTRWASKKTSGSSRNPKGHARPKHRAWKRQDGHEVVQGTILATQNKLRWHPGLNVGFGRNATLWAMVPGKVVVTCEVPDLNWDHTWVYGNHASRRHTQFHKKYFNVIPYKQHQNFKLIDEV